MGAGVARTMFTKQVSRPEDSLDPRSWPRRQSRSSELEEKPGHGPDPKFSCPIWSLIRAMHGSTTARDARARR